MLYYPSAKLFLGKTLTEDVREEGAEEYIWT